MGNRKLFGQFENGTSYTLAFETIDELEQATHGYIRYYNEERIRLKLKGLDPI